MPQPLTASPAGTTTTTTTRSRRAVCALMALLGLFTSALGIGGCQSSPAGAGGAGGAGGTPTPLAPELAKDDPDSQMEFWHSLPQRHVASNDEAFHALLLFVDGSDRSADYAGRVSAMKQRKMIPDDFAGVQSGAVKRGTVAVAIARALEIKGGLTMRLFGSSPRYATRELQYMNLFPQSSPQQTFSGQELLGIIGRAEDYQRMFNENALADAGDTTAAPTEPPRGPARGDAEVTAPESSAPDSAPQQP